MATATNYDPAKAGFRVADPIRRKPRQPSSRPQPKPRYADSVWWSFENGTPLEVTVPTRAVDDAVRLLKRSARYLERNRDVEVRVQISVEPVMVQAVEDGQPVFDGKGEPVMVPAKPAKSVVKFLGHKPWLLGRRIAKEAGEAPEVPQPPELPAPSAPVGQHRRTVAGTRPAQHRMASLPDAMVRAVITRPRPPCPVSTREWGSWCFCVVSPRTQPRVFASCYPRYGPVVSCHSTASFRRQASG